MTESLDRAAIALGELSTSVRALTKEVLESESLRLRKIKVIQQGLYVLVPSVIILIIMAITNFMLLSRAADTAEQVRSTNGLLLGCFQQHTKCSDAAKVDSQQRAAQLQQSQFVSLYCARQNPVENDPDAARLYACFKQYYPEFTLPTKLAPTPKR